MFTGKGLVYLSFIVQLISNKKVVAYKSGCRDGYCFLISDYANSNDFITQSSAQQRCLSNGTNLVVIASEDIQTSVVNFIKNVYSEGLNKWNILTYGKRSSGGNWKRLSGNGIDSLTVSQQTDISFAYVYVTSSASGFALFASRPGNYNGGYICAGSSFCSGGVTISGQCYKSFKEAISWYDARNRCLESAGDLASFDYATTNTELNALNGSWIDPSNSYWIGIRRESWTWQGTDSDVKFSDWSSGHPLNEVNRINSDCLCLSYADWKWIECGCTEQLPFVCIMETKASTSISTTTRTTPSSATVLTSKATFATASKVVSAGLGVSTPTIPATMTTNSALTENNTEGKRQSMGLSSQATIGIGVGVGVGGALVILALVVAAIILCRKRCPLRCPQRRKTHAKLQTPDILMTDSENTHHISNGIENSYAVVVSSPGITEADSYENSSHTPIVYAPLAFATGLQSPRPGSVTIVPGRTNPVQVPSTPKLNAANDHITAGGDLYAEVTKA